MATKENEIAKGLTAPLSIEDIDFRVARSKKLGNGKLMVSLLAYKNARVDMKRLDEVCGIFGWERQHKELKGVIYCGITINGITKWDAGTESYAEAQKGEASDSFKRAGFNWGIGRELYDYPDIVFYLPPELQYNDKPAFKISDVTWKLELDAEGKVLKLQAAIKNKEGKWFNLYKYEDKPSASTSSVKGIEVTKK
jgi:hypothetical protein